MKIMSDIQIEKEEKDKIDDGVTVSEGKKITDRTRTDYEEIYRRIIEMDESLEPFVNEVREIIPSQDGEVDKLSRQVRLGDRDARERMIDMYLRVALKTALYHAEKYGTDIQDAVDLACIGLISAVDHFDPEKSGIFSYYAFKSIFRAVTGRHPQKSEHDPLLSLEELVSDLYDGVENYEDDDLDDDPAGDVRFPDALLSGENVEGTAVKDSLRWEIDGVLSYLRESQREALTLVYGLDDKGEKCFREAGEELNLTANQVRALERDGLRKLRYPQKSRKIRDYLWEME